MVKKETILRDINSCWNTNSTQIQQRRINILKSISSFKKIDATIILTEWDEFK